MSGERCAAGRHRACVGSRPRGGTGYAPAMRRTVWPAVAAAVALVLGGCSEGDGGCGEDDRPEPTRSAGARLPVAVGARSQPPEISGKAIEAALPPRKARPSLMDQAMRHLMSDTLTMAGAIGDIRPGACEKAVVEEGEGATHRCTVFYEGLEVVWKVRFSDVDASGGWTTASYRAWPVKGVLRAETVYAAYAWAHPEKDLAPRCDRMPEIFRAEAGKATGYECQILLGECSDGAWRLKWVNQPVWIGGEGRVEFGDPEPVS